MQDALFISHSSLYVWPSLPHTRFGTAKHRSGQRHNAVPSRVATHSALKSHILPLHGPKKQQKHTTLRQPFKSFSGIQIHVFLYENQLATKPVKNLQQARQSNTNTSSNCLDEVSILLQIDFSLRTVSI